MFRTFSKLTRNAVSNFSFSTNKASFNKVVSSIDEALVGIKTGDKVLVGGFGLCGSPENLLGGIKKLGSDKLKDITIVSNNFGIDGYGPGILLHTNQVKRVMVSYFGENRELERQYIEGELEVEFIPQGTLAEKCRAGGAGIPAFYTPTGVGTPVQFGGFPIKYKKGTMEAEILTEPRECVKINGKDYLREMSITGDFGLIKAWKADKKGNLIFNKTARNMNPDFATAAKITVAEVEEIVEEGDLHPNEIHIPGIYIDRVIKGDHYVKKIEKVMYDEPEGGKEVSKAQLKRNRIAQRAAKEIQTGTYINLGVGLPTLIPGFLPQGVEVILQSENGVLGVGKYPRPGQEDPDLINAGKETITVNPAASYFSSSQSFAIIRGRHLDWTVLGGMQVSQTGDLSNWVIPGKRVKGMGGAMDLVSSGSKVMVMMEHVNKNGEHKILKQNVLPLTGKGVVNVLVTDMATFKFREDGMYLTEIEKGYSLEDVRRATGADFKVADDLKQAQ